jgi:phosphatidylserine decarboxylase
MTKRALAAFAHRCMQQDEINFWLTNCARGLLTRWIAWFSRLEHPLVRDASIATWTFFADLDLNDARETAFKSMHACFTRQLKDGARPVDFDQDYLTCPCDALVGAHGQVDDTTLIQAKGQTYTLAELLGDPSLVETYRRGCYVTLRLTSAMYHRFHAPYACRIRHITYISGDTWNVNPATLKRVAKLFCKNERALVRAELAGNTDVITLVPVAAVLVASIRLNFLDVPLCLQYRGPNEIDCDQSFNKGEEMGWFEHGSTIIVLAPQGYVLREGIVEGSLIRMGQALMRLPTKVS